MKFKINLYYYFFLRDFGIIKNVFLDLIYDYLKVRIGQGVKYVKYKISNEYNLAFLIMRFIGF